MMILGGSFGFRNLVSPSSAPEWTWLDPMVGVPFCHEKHSLWVNSCSSSCNNCCSNVQNLNMMQNLYHCQVNRMNVLEARIKSMQGVYNSDKNKFKRYENSLLVSKVIEA